MISIVEQGTVISKSNGKAKISLEQKDICTKCGKCGQGENGKFFIFANDPLHSKPGQKVEIRVNTTSKLKSIILVYVLPLLLFVFANVVIYSILKEAGYNEDKTVLITVGGSLLVLIITGYLISIWSKRHFKTEVVRIIG